MVHLNLDRDDKMEVETFHDGTMTMNFKGTDGTTLDYEQFNKYDVKFTEEDVSVRQ